LLVEVRKENSKALLLIILFSEFFRALLILSFLSRIFYSELYFSQYFFIRLSVKIKIISILRISEMNVGDNSGLNELSSIFTRYSRPV